MMIGLQFSVVFVGAAGRWAVMVSMLMATVV